MVQFSNRRLYANIAMAHVKGLDLQIRRSWPRSQSLSRPPEMRPKKLKHCIQLDPGVGVEDTRRVVAASGRLEHTPTLEHFGGARHAVGCFEIHPLQRRGVHAPSLGQLSALPEVEGV